MARDPLPFGSGVAQPRSAPFKDQTGVALAEVVEIVGYRFAHVKRGVVLECLKNRPDRAWIIDQTFELLAPWQEWSHSLCAPSPHVRIRVAGQREQPLKSGRGKTLHKWSDGKFRGEPFRQFGHGLERFLNMVKPVVGDELSQGPLEPPSVVDRFQTVVQRRQTISEDFERFGTYRQAASQAIREPPNAGLKLQFLYLMGGVSDELLLRECRPGRGKLSGQGGCGSGVEPVLEGFLFGRLGQIRLLSGSTRG